MVQALGQTHLFSLYTPNLKLNSWVASQSVTISDAEIVHRMNKVLRFEVKDSCVLFDQHLSAQVTITEISKKHIAFSVVHIQNHKPLQPHVTFLLPLLKKEALEDAVYSLCELGINTIQLVVTQKSRQSLMHDKELQRLQGIVIAAAEQSKNYNLSELIAPKKLAEIVDQPSKQALSIVFDPAGISFFDVKEKLSSSSQTPIWDPEKPKNSSTYYLLVGPEGGLTDQELSFVQNSKFVSCALTPTILRAVQAVVLGAGLVRLKN